MKVKIKEVFLCIFVILAVLLAASWAQRYDASEFDDLEDKDSDITNTEQEQENQESNADNWWQGMADTNQDGTVDDGELSAWNDLKRKRESSRVYPDFRGKFSKKIHITVLHPNRYKVIR